MKFALATFGTRGDVQPFLALARGLQQAGHSAVLCAPPNFGAWASSVGVPFAPMGSDFQAFFERINGGISKAARALEAELPLHFEHLLSAAKGCDAVLGTASAVAAPSVAEALRVPFRYVAMSPQALPSAHHPPPYVPWPSQPSWLNAAWWRLVRLSFDTLGKGTLNRQRAALGLLPVDDVLSHVLPRRSFVAVDPLLAPLPPDLSAEAVATGAWVLDEDAPLPPELEAFLAAGPPPLCITFGSMVDPDPDGTTRLLLDARPKGARLLLLRGWARLGRGPLPDGVLALEPVPFSRLFPRVSAVIHHGGAGTTATAARAGVPQVVVPHILDQPYWGTQVHRLGLGPRPIPRARLSAAKLSAALAEALSDACRARVRDVASQLPHDGVARAVALAVAEVERARAA